jgi:hypothetical protein
MANYCTIHNDLSLPVLKTGTILVFQSLRLTASAQAQAPGPGRTLGMLKVEPNT